MALIKPSSKRLSLKFHAHYAGRVNRQLTQQDRWKTQDGRKTKKCRVRLCIPNLTRHFFVILPSRVLQPSCCVKSNDDIPPPIYKQSCGGNHRQKSFFFKNIWCEQVPSDRRRKKSQPAGTNVGWVAPSPCRPKLRSPNLSYLAPTTKLCSPNIEAVSINSNDYILYNHNCA